MDLRTTPFNGRVAHVSLKGQIEADRFVEGELMRVVYSIADFFRAPHGARDRQLLSGQAFRVLDIQDEWAFGFSEYDGYCGWILYQALLATEHTTHRVWTRESFWRAEPELKYDALDSPKYLGSEVRVFQTTGDWSCIGPDQYMPSVHLKRIEDFETDTVAVARRLLGAPYVWGGNSARGIDCSGLVQAAFRACGISCPGDSDLQMNMAGIALDAGDPLQPGDLLFWKGHVAMATGPDAMIHANAHHMAVVEEAIEPALARISATDTGPITLRLRPSLPTG
ncbi:MAG: C40 family peptidase [Silicimonas sp.]|nr:C40 family peptidase [Silicimonas sp.]